jgi:hypothetical protein
MNYALVVGRILRKLNQVRFRSFNRSDNSVESRRQVENTDALASTGGREGEASSVAAQINAPPNYVPPVDEGRPRH